MKGARVAFAAALAGLSASGALGFGIFGNTGLSGGFRWDAAPRTAGGLERSLDGGLRFSLQGGNYQTYRDSFQWSGGAPTVAAFQAAVNAAFQAWRAVDPLTLLGTTITFTEDLGTAVDPNVVSGVRLGSEIDLFAHNFGDNGLRADAWFNAVGGTPYTLTSGTANYATGAISGADIRMNANVNARWTLPIFQTVLTHEIGHALGLADVDLNSGPNGTFIDDNFNGSSSATALATLTNSFALLVNPMNPAVSPLSLYTVQNGDPGFDTPGVEILMESAISGFFIGNPNPLQNDDFAGRQFLYPTFPVPEPATMAALALGAALLVRRRRR
jgi:hypothetical protein